MEQTEKLDFLIQSLVQLSRMESGIILCYSGNKCAKTAISVMKDAGFDTDNLFIIENGAKDGDVSAAFVTE